MVVELSSVVDPDNERFRRQRAERALRALDPSYLYLETFSAGWV